MLGRRASAVLVLALLSQAAACAPALHAVREGRAERTEQETIDERAQAREAFERGPIIETPPDPAAAARALRDAYERAPHPVLLWNLALAHEAAGDLAEASASLDRYLASGDTRAPSGEVDRCWWRLHAPRGLALVYAGATEASPRLAVDPTTMPEEVAVFVEGLSLGAAPLVAPLPAGERAIELRAAGYTPWRARIVMRDGLAVRVRFDDRFAPFLEECPSRDPSAPGHDPLCAEPPTRVP